MRRFGLIGKKLSHSFSQKFFNEKFKILDLKDHQYDLLELEKIDQIEEILCDRELKGLNVTVPYKEAIIPYLDELDVSAKRIGAVNVVKKIQNKSVGFNSDYLGFKQSLSKWLPRQFNGKALVLGTGGASKAVSASLIDLDISFKLVSRTPSDESISYDQIGSLLDYILVINTTPLGMSPQIDSSPSIPYDHLTSNHFLYDLVYNPEKTLFLKNGETKGCKIKNGLEMLHLQAEESWRIWNEE